MVFNPSETTKKHLVCAKDSVPRGRQDGIMYVMILCSACDSTYIGETGRRVQERTKEHKKYFLFPD